MNNEPGPDPGTEGADESGQRPRASRSPDRAEETRIRAELDGLLGAAKSDYQMVLKTSPELAEHLRENNKLEEAEAEYRAVVAGFASRAEVGNEGEAIIARYRLARV